MPKVNLSKLCCHVSDAEAYTDHAVIHKKVGEDMELSLFQGGDALSVKLLYNDLIVAEYSGSLVNYPGPFAGRLYLNITNFSFKLKHLNVQDSGNFSFISSSWGRPPKQHPTVFFTLQVHGKTLLSSSTYLINYSSRPKINHSRALKRLIRGPDDSACPDLQLHYGRTDRHLHR